MEYIATQRYIRVSPRKLRESTFMIRKLTPVRAIEMLPHANKRSAEIVLKAMKAAVANATQKGANPSDLVLKEIQVNEGPRLKRFRAGSRGAAQPYQRKMSHLRIVLAAEAKPKKVEAKATEAKQKEKAESKVKKGDK